MAGEKPIVLLDFLKIINSDLVSLLLKKTCQKHCKSNDNILKFRRLRRDIKVAAFLIWLAEQFSSPS